MDGPDGSQFFDVEKYRYVVSPDLNPIENLWGLLSKRIYSAVCQYGTLLELKVAIREEWKKIDITLLKALVNSMRRRIMEIIIKRGRKMHF